MDSTANNLSDTDMKAYEAYLLANSEEEQLAAIKNLIPGSYLFYHLFFLHCFKKNKGVLNEDEQKLYEEFEKKYDNRDGHPTEMDQIS